MTDTAFEQAFAALTTAFPLTAIVSSNLRMRDLRDADRVETELRVSRIEGRTWLEISLEQARGTWDMLPLLSGESLLQLYPGYLKWLWNVEEADVLISAVPRLLVESLDGESGRLNTSKLRAISRFLIALLSNLGDEITWNQGEAIRKASLLLLRLLV